MRANMENILAITVTGDEERLPMLIAAMGSVLANVDNLDWVVIFQHKKDIPALNLMVDLGAINNNHITFLGGNPEYSVAKEKAKYLIFYLNKNKSRKYVLNIDDDMIIDSITLEYLGRCALKENDNLFIATQFDVNNNRQFLDYDNKVRYVGFNRSGSPELEEFIIEYGEHLVAHHLWSCISSSEESFPIQIPVRAMSGLWMGKIKAIDSKGLLNEFLLWPKGKRGYDVYLSMTMGKAIYLIPTRAYHIGLDSPYYNSNWDSHKEGIKKEWEGK